MSKETGSHDLDRLYRMSQLERFTRPQFLMAMRLGRDVFPGTHAEFVWFVARRCKVSHPTACNWVSGASAPHDLGRGPAVRQLCREILRLLADRIP